MGFHSFVLLTATVLLACVKCSSKATAATFPVQETAERPNRRFATRFLRSSEPTDGDDEARMLPMLNEAKSVYRTLQDRYRVWNWMVAQKMTDEEIIAKLKIKDNVLSFLESSKAQLLWEVARAFSERSKSSQNPLLNTLLVLHNRDEAALARTLYAASQSKTELTKKAATNLLELQYKEWQKGKKTAKEIFDIMRKGQSDYEVFADRNLEVLEGFIQFSGRVEDSRAALVDAMVIGFGGKRKFLDALMSAETFKHQELDTINRLERVARADWRNKELHPENVIKKELGMKELEDLVSPAMQAVINYINIYNAEHEQHPFSLIKMFTKSYGSASVTNTLIKAKENGLEEYATQLMGEQTNRWLDDRKSVKEVIQLLNIGGDGYEHLKEAKFQMLKEYSEAYQDPETASPDIFGLLRDAFENEEECFLVIAKVMKSWKRSLGTLQWQATQRLQWLEDILEDGFKQRIPNLTSKDVKTKFSHFKGADIADVELIVDEYKSWKMLDEVAIFTKPRRA